MADVGPVMDGPPGPDGAPVGGGGPVADPGSGGGGGGGINTKTMLYIAAGAIVLLLIYRWYKNRQASSVSANPATQATGAIDPSTGQPYSGPPLPPTIIVNVPGSGNTSGSSGTGNGQQNGNHPGGNVPPGKVAPGPSGGIRGGNHPTVKAGGTTLEGLVGGGSARNHIGSGSISPVHVGGTTGKIAPSHNPTPKGGHAPGAGVNANPPTNRETGVTHTGNPVAVSGGRQVL